MLVEEDVLEVVVEEVVVVQVVVDVVVEVVVEEVVVTTNGFGFFLPESASLVIQYKGLLI